jgi:hypothetical protein
MVFGPDGWVFGTESHSLEVFRGLEPFPPRRLDGWRRVFEARRAWHAERGVRYVYALIPNKDRACAEHLPPALTVCGPTRMEELQRYLAATGTEPVLDLLPLLLDAKRSDGELGRDDCVYYPLGTHWTDRGAFAVYEALADRIAPLAPNFRRLARADFRVVEEGEGDSVAPSMYLADLLPQRAWRWHVAERRARYDESLVGRNGATLETNVDDPRLPTAIVFHDSFGENLRPMLAEGFRRAIFVWGSFEPDVIEREKPDVVSSCTSTARCSRCRPSCARSRATRPRASVSSARRTCSLRSPPNHRACSRAPRSAPRSSGARARSRCSAGARDRASRSRSRHRPRPAGAVLHLDVTVAKEGSVDVLYRHAGELEFDRSDVASADLVAGRNDVYLEITDDHLVGPLRVMFPPSKQAVLLHALEVRADETPLAARR